MVEVSNKHKSITVSVSSNNGNTIVAASSDTAQYWSNTSKKYSEEAKISALEAEQAKNEVLAQKDSVLSDIENVRAEAVESVTAIANNGVASVEEKVNTGIAEINNTKNSAVDAVNSTKTTILNDIEFIADGEKKEIEELIDNGKEELKESIGDVKVLTTLEIGDIGIAPLGIDETKGKRRYLNGQVIIQEQYVQFTEKVKSAIALYPSLACTESEWQTTATMTVGGQVGKFVVDDEAGTIRLPKIIMPIQGLTDLSKLGEIVEAGLPNITGGFGLAQMISGTDYANGVFQVTKTSTNFGSRNSGSQADDHFTFDASRSNPIYGNSDTVQQEQIQYPYFIQVATGAETKDEIENEQVLNNPFFIGYSQYFENAPYNLSWSVGGSTLTRAVHPAYYDALLIELNADIEVGTTQNNYTKRGLPVKLATDSDITDYDFVVNPADETFTLPLLNGSESIIDWDNIIKDLSPDVDHIIPCNGALIYSIQSAYVGKGETGFTIIINGEQYIFGQGYSGTDYPHPTNGFLQLKKGDVINISVSVGQKIHFVKYVGNGSLNFYVGEVAQNTNLINAGRIEETLVNKVDKDSSWGFPSDRYIDLTLGASGTTYTAPAKGYVYIQGMTNSEQTINHFVQVYVGDISYSDAVFGASMYCGVVCPVLKGQTFKVSYTRFVSNYFRFYYAEGGGDK